MRPLAIIWDIDGTLIDSEPLHQRALEAVCDSYNVDISDLAPDHFTGINIHQVWDALCARFPKTLQRADWESQINSFYGANAPHLTEIPGAAETVRALANLGIRQAAVSNSNRIIVDANLDSLGIAQMLEFSFSLEDVSRPKPDPEPYLLALKRMGLAPHMAIAIEDSFSGVSSARAAQIHTLCYRSSHGADQVIQSLAEILEMF